MGSDLACLEAEHAARAERLAGSDVYSSFNPAQLFILQPRQRQILGALRAAGCFPLEGRRVLEVGCGSGGVLLELLQAGARAGCLHGIDYLPGSLRRLFPGCTLQFRKITLAPPIVKRLVGLSWILCALLEKPGIFNTHYLVTITP